MKPRKSRNACTLQILLGVSKLGKVKLIMDRLHLDFGFNFKKAWTQLYKTTTVYEMTGVIYYLKFVNVCFTVSCLQKAV